MCSGSRSAEPGAPNSRSRDPGRARAAGPRCDAWERGAVGVWLRRTGSGQPPRAELAEPWRLQIEGDREKAAHTWADLGCPYDTAMVLQDTEQEAALREAPANLHRSWRIGCGPAQIAGQLFISAKTVDHHVSAILAKLDVPTRSAAASQAAAVGLVGATPN